MWRPLGTVLLLIGFMGWGSLPEAQQPMSSTEQSQDMSENEFFGLMHRLAAAWNRGDAKAAAECFTKDAIYSEPPGRQLYRGSSELYEFFGGDEGRPGQMKMVWHHLTFNSRTQVGAGEFSFTYGTTAHGVAVVRVQGGRISNWREYWRGSPLSWQEFIHPNNF